MKYALVAVGVLISGMAFAGLAVRKEDLESGAIELSGDGEGKSRLTQTVNGAKVVLVEVETSGIGDREESDEIPDDFFRVDVLAVIQPDMTL